MSDDSYIEEKITITFRDAPIERAERYWNIGGPFIVYDIETNEPFLRYYGDCGRLTAEEAVQTACFECHYARAVLYARNRALDGYACYLLDHGDDRSGQCEFYEPVGQKFEITTDPDEAPETDEEYWERYPWVKHWEEEMG